MNKSKENITIEFGCSRLEPLDDNVKSVFCPLKERGVVIEQECRKEDEHNWICINPQGRKKETLVLKVVTNSKEKTLQMIVPIMGCEVYELKDPSQAKFIDKLCDLTGSWKHLKKKGK